MKSNISISVFSIQAEKINKNAFTLVELIIVITILAILATIAFVSFQNYTKDARDGNRVVTLNQIDNGLQSIEIKTGKYPMPEGIIFTGVLKIGTEEGVYSYIGIIDEIISGVIKMNKIPIDPVMSSNYVYAVNNDQSKYQVATVLEKLEANTLPIIAQTYANDDYKAKVIGNHEVSIKVSKGNYTYITTIPSMIFTGTGNILNSSGTYHVVNGGKNLPYGIKNRVITMIQKGDELMKNIRKDGDAKITTIDITEIVNATDDVRKTKIEEIFGTGNTQESKEILVSIGVITGKEEIIDLQKLSQTLENIITNPVNSTFESNPQSVVNIVGDFTIPTTTNSTNLTVNINCPTGSPHTPIQMYISGDITSTPTWEDCENTKNIVLTSIDGNKTITMKWKDFLGNQTDSISKSIDLNSSYFIGTGDSANPWISSDGIALTSCQAYNLNALSKNDGTLRGSGTCGSGTQGCLLDGVYYIAPDSNQTHKFPIYCNMTNEGGGWTLAFKITYGMLPTCYNNSSGCNISNLTNITFDSSGRISNEALNAISSRTNSVIKIIRSDKGFTSDWYHRVSGENWPTNLEMTSGNSCANNFLCTVYSNYSDAVSNVNQTVVGGYFGGTQYYPTAYSHFGQRFGYSAYPGEAGMRYQIGGGAVANQSGVILIK